MVHSPSDGPVNLDFDEVEQSRNWPRYSTLVFVAILAGLLVVFFYDLMVLAPRAPLLDESPWPFDAWDPSQIDWMLIFSLVMICYWSLLSVVRHPSRIRLYARGLRGDPAALISLVVVVGVAVVGIVSPFIVTPELNILASYQPPVFTTVNTNLLANCLGKVTNSHCHGTMQYPLGATYEGRSVLEYTIVATRTPVVIGLVTGVIIVPIAVSIGTISAYFGGWIDDVLMRLVEVVQVVPPLVVYIILRVTLGGGDMFLLVSVFGLLSWASVARLIRTEVLTYREELFVTAAEAAGGSRWYITRRHILPNLIGTVLTATTLQIPNLILTEVALSFLNFGVPRVSSWGTLIADGTLGNPFASMIRIWWISLFPVLALAITVVALSVLGDRLQDVFDFRT